VVVSAPCTSAVGEFELIERYFQRPARQAVLGVGDDCALLQPAPGTQLAVSCDMLVAGRHFLADVAPDALGHKALAVNLSDLAACGAKPLAFNLALALPRVDQAWLAAFAQGLFALADAHGCELIGGDTTQGPLTICITVFGEVPTHAGRSQALLRAAAQVGDDLYVSGNLGDARLALQALLGHVPLPAPLLRQARERLERPSPRVALGLALRAVAHAAIDVSDGLLGDLNHVLKRSGVGACVNADAVAALLAARTHPLFAQAKLSPCDVRAWTLAGGDDYELLFTAAPAQRAAVAAAATASQTPVHRIGQIEQALGVRLLSQSGEPVAHTFTSFDHFA
jgi:thiamine-monophosphate kinase